MMKGRIDTRHTKSRGPDENRTTVEPVLNSIESNKMIYCLLNILPDSETSIYRCLYLEKNVKISLKKASNSIFKKINDVICSK